MNRRERLRKAEKLGLKDATEKAHRVIDEHGPSDDTPPLITAESTEDTPVLAVDESEFDSIVPGEDEQALID